MSLQRTISRNMHKHSTFVQESRKRGREVKKILEKARKRKHV
jgi:hypothetical protein